MREFARWSLENKQFHCSVERNREGWGKIRLTKTVPIPTKANEEFAC